MNQFWVFTKKEFFHIFRDRWTVLMLLLLPIVMVILFGFGITTEINNAKVAIFDPSRDVTTTAMINQIASSEYFSIERYLDSYEDINTIFKTDNIGLVVAFSERFQENMMHTGEAQILLVSDGTDPNTASTLTQYAQSMLMEYQLNTFKHGLPQYSIMTEVKLLYNPTMKGAFNTVPGVIGMVLMLVCAMMTSVSMAREKETGTMEVILVSPMPPLMIVFSKVLPYFMISMLNLLNVLLLAVFVLDVPIVGSIPLLVGVSLLFIFVCLAIGLLISTMVETQLVALLASVMGLMMPVIMLSGLMFPIESMPLILQGISQLIPAKWFISAMRAVMIQGLGLTDIWKELAVLSAMAVTLVSVSLKKFKIRLE